MKKLVLFLLFVTIISFGQGVGQMPTSGIIKDIGGDKYTASISSGNFSMGLKWVPKKRNQLEYKIQQFVNSVGADSYTKINEYTEPTHSGGRYGTYGALDITFSLVFPDTELTSETKTSLTQYYDTNTLDPMEGIYKSADGTYTIGIKKYDKLFKALIINSDNQNWKIGEVKAVFSYTATPGVYSIKYYMGNKNKKESFGIIENTGILSIPLGGDNIANFIKMYPSVKTVSKTLKEGEWVGNGSGIIISIDGFIVTNNHVVKDVSKIEVEFKYAQEIKKFNAKIIKTDAINDLAIIQIDDSEYRNLKSIPYNFKTRSADVGEEVFALGYPKALSLMGKEIKFTDGRISSKTGFQDDITCYQTTTPIQPGNSGGPLFDHRGNLLGINSAKIVSEDVEGVSYTIKTSYLLNLIDVLPKSISIPSSTVLLTKPLTEQIKVLSDYVVLIKVK